MKAKLTKRGILFSWEINTRVTSKKKKKQVLDIQTVGIMCGSGNSCP